MAKAEKKKNCTTVCIDFSEEKMEALVQFLEEKGASLGQELTEYTEKLYEKTVPPQVKKFLEAREKRTAGEPQEL